MLGSCASGHPRVEKPPVLGTRKLGARPTLPRAAPAPYPITWPTGIAAKFSAPAGAFPQYGLRCQIAIVARPDADKGERLLAVTNEPRLTLDALRAVLREKGLPNLAFPRDLHVVPQIPKLGTGKTDHRALEKLL